MTINQKLLRNDLKKGDEVVLKGGQKAVIANNKRGAIRTMSIQQIRE
jgi:preprotein translocase subunit YajC